jgi:hypothetical protein
MQAYARHGGFLYGQMREARGARHHAQGRDPAVSGDLHKGLAVSSIMIEWTGPEKNLQIQCAVI